MAEDFMECDECRSKPGAPVLCRACLHNRALVAKLKRAVAEERARCAKIARSRRGGLISGEAALEIAAEIEKG